MTDGRDTRRERERGQGIVEFTMIVPIVLLLVVSVAELGIAYSDTLTIGYGSREGARVGSALATGETEGCGEGSDPAGVDVALVSAVQRILKSPGSGLDAADVLQIRIFKADSAGSEVAGSVNLWTYAGEGLGAEAEEGPPSVRLDFAPYTVPWPACARVNDGPSPDSIGVTVRYRYDFVNPLASMLDAITGGSASLTLTETTVMALNPSA